MVILRPIRLVHPLITAIRILEQMNNHNRKNIELGKVFPSDDVEISRAEGKLAPEKCFPLALNVSPMSGREENNENFHAPSRKTFLASRHVLLFVCVAQCYQHGASSTAGKCIFSLSVCIFQ